MRKGFTLLELIVVIIIVGVLATLGFTQYGAMIEKSRGAEAKAICGDIRKLAAAYRLERGTVTGVIASDLNIGTSTDQIPSTCSQSSHYFSYSVAAADPTITITATRCGTGTGKTPGSTNAGTIVLTTNLTTGVDSWTGTGVWH